MSGSKLFRLFSLFLCLLLCLANFSVVASAADVENLVSPDLRTWQLGSGVDSTLIDPNAFYYNSDYNYSRIRIRFPSDQDYGYAGTSLIFDVPSLDVGVNYQFSFSVPTLDIVQRAFPHVDSLERFFGEHVLCRVGVGYIDSNNDLVFYDNCYSDITSLNLSSYIGYNYVQSFKLDNIIGIPVFAIQVTSVGSIESYLFFQNLSVTRVSSESEKKLDGILGWLQELWNSIKDGFSNLGGKISELGSSITDDFNRFWDTISERLDVSEGYLVEIKNFFHDLYWDLVGGTCKYGDEHTSLFERLGNRIGGFFDDMKLKIDLKVEEIKTSIHDFFVPPEDFFNNWKTRFNAMLEHNLGFVYQAPNFVVQVVNCIQDVINTKTEPNLVFPKVEFDIVGYHVVLFEDTAVDFSFLDSGIWATVYGMYKVMVHAILAFALIKFAQDTWERMMSN